MNTIPFRRLPSESTPRDTATRLNDILPNATTAEADALRALLSVAGGPTRRGELDGESAAVDAFRAAQPATGAGTSWTRSTRATLLTVKTAVASLVLASVGGVALAANGAPIPFLDAPNQTPRIEAPVERDGADTRKTGEDTEPATADDVVPGTSYEVTEKAVDKGKSAEARERAADKAAERGKSAEARVRAAENAADKGKSGEARERAAEKAADKGKSAEARERATDKAGDKGNSGEARKRAGDKGADDAAGKGKSGEARERAPDRPTLGR